MINFLIVVFLQYILVSNKNGCTNATPLYGPYVRYAQPKEFPFVVSVGSKNETNHICTGVLISQQHVITAGHCLRRKEASTLQVKVGSVDLEQAKIYDVESFVTYHEWAKRHNAVSFRFKNLAVIKLTKLITERGVFSTSYDKKVQIDKFLGKMVETAGWGSVDGDEHNQVLRTAFLHVIDKATCANNTDYKIGELDEVFCTSIEPYVTLGYGDSGGPLLYNNVIIGINDSAWPIRRHADAKSDVLNYHTVISFYTPFIEDALDGFIRYGNCSYQFLK